MRYLEPSWGRPDSKPKIQHLFWIQTGHKHNNSMGKHRLWLDHKMAKITGSLFLNCKWFSHPTFLSPSPLHSPSLLQVPTSKPCSFLNLTTKLSGWALRIKWAPSQPCSFILIADRNFTILTSSSNYLSYFKDAAFISPKVSDPNNLLGAERWPQSENMTPPEKKIWL